MKRKHIFLPALPEDQQKELNELIAKRLTPDFTKKDEERYCYLNHKYSGLPMKVFSKSFENRMDNVISRTDKLIERVRKKGHLEL